MLKTTNNDSKIFPLGEPHRIVLIGTASDRYAGWIGQIYSEGRHEKGVIRRSHKVGDKTFNGEKMPVEGVAEYFGTSLSKLGQDLDEFFSKIPKDTRYHIELRTDAYLVDPAFDVLKKHGVGLAYSPWTWPSPLWKQFAKVERSFSIPENQPVIRLITPLRMSYEESYAKAFPFDKVVPGMLHPEMT